MMTDDAKIEARFWKALASDRVVMLGVDGVEDGFARPMIVQIDEERSPLWFFSSSENISSKSLPRAAAPSLPSRRRESFTPRSRAT